MFEKVVRDPACNMYILELSLNDASARAGMRVPWWSSQSSLISASAVESWGSGTSWPRPLTTMRLPRLCAGRPSRAAPKSKTWELSV